SIKVSSNFCQSNHPMAVHISIAKESELQARLRIVQNAFKERNNCIVLRLDTHVNGEKGMNPFGFHFEFDRAKYEENKERKRRESITRWLALAAFIHHKFGIRHILLVIMMSLYAILGGFMFEALEAENEREIVALTVHDMNIVISDFVDLIVNVSLTETNETVRTNTLAIASKKFYTSMLITEDRYLGSAWHKAEDLDLNIQWTVLPAMFYAFTLFSTIGYGSISCNTWVGRYVSILYACIGIPLMLLTIGDLGEVLQRMMCRLLIWIEIKWSCCRKNKVNEDVENNNKEEEEEDEEEPELVLPVWIAVSMLLIYLCLVSVFIWLGDMMGEQKTDFSLAASFYFVFISITTTGFGDVMPNSAQFNPLTSLSFLFGLVLLSIINSSVYSQLYDSFYTGVMAMEGTLDAIHADAYETSGHKVFKRLSSVFSTLSLSFPSTAFSAPINNNLTLPHITLTSPITKRTHSEGTIQSLEIEGRSHSINLPQIPEEVAPRSVRALSEEARPRTRSLLSTHGTYGDFTYPSRLGSPTLGPLGGVDIASAHRRRGIARMKRNASNSSD
ncbi:hypothetical protein PENTCL1PPCAC_6762, partial [Pristionchus entomophagus]